MSVQQQLYHKVYALADAAQSPEQIKALQQHLSQSLQDNVIPAYVGVPLMQGLTQRLQQASAMPQGPQAPQPPVAQQVMQAAQQADMPRQAVAPQGMPAPQGIDQLPSNLPTEGMAQGGIIAFDGTGPYGSQVPNEADLQYALANQQAVGGSNPYAKAYAGIKDVLSAPFAYRTVIDPATKTPRSARDVYGYTPNLDEYNAKEQGQATGITNALAQMTPSAKVAQATAAHDITTEALNPRDLTSQFTNPAQGTPSSTTTSSGPTIDAAKALSDKLTPTAPTAPLSVLDTLAAQLAARKGGSKGVVYKPMVDEGADYEALLQAPKTIAEYVAEKKARIGENPALAERATKLATMEEENKSADEKSPWMALMKAGLATMGGTSQFAGVNIGKGGEAGLDDYIKAQDKITVKKEKLYDAQTALGDAKRNEQLALEKYGEDSKQAEEAKNFTIKTAKIANKHAVDLANHTGEFDASKTNASLASAQGIANQSAQVQLAINKADIDARKYISDMTNTRDIDKSTRALYDKAHDNAVADIKLEVGDKPDYMTGPYKSGAEVQQALMRSIVKNQRAMNLPIMLPPGYSEQPSGAGKIGAVDKKLGYDYNYIPNKG